jgi:hypothetical protein
VSNPQSDAQKRKARAVATAAKAKAAAATAKQQADVFASIKDQFGLTDAMLGLDKTNAKKGFTLREAFDYIRTQKITDARRAADVLAKTDWFKTHGVNVTKRMTDEASGSGGFKESVAATKATLADQLAAKGIKLSDADMNKLARDSYVFGFDSSRMFDAAAKDKYTSTGGGEIQNTMDSLNSMAYANGVTLSQNDRDLWSRQLLDGSGNAVGIQKTLRDRAAALYPPFAEQIHSGANLSDLTSSYRSMASSLLEVDQNDIGMSDPLFKDGKAFMQVGVDGKMQQKPLWEFRKEVQADPRWANTDNARDKASAFGEQVLKKFGMA